MNLSVAAVCDTLTFMSDSSFYYGIFFLFLGCSFWTATMLMIKTLYDYHTSFQYSGRSTTAKVENLNKQQYSIGLFCSKYFSKETKKLNYTIAGFVLIGMMQFQSGSSYVSSPIALSTTQVVANRDTATFYYYILPFWTGIGLMLYSTWIPIFPWCPCKGERTERIKTNASQKRPESSYQKRSRMENNNSQVD